jgi:hypothetical protein
MARPPAHLAVGADVEQESKAVPLGLEHPVSAGGPAAGGDTQHRLDHRCRRLRRRRLGSAYSVGDTQPLQRLHRFGGAVGQRVKRVGRQSECVDRDASCLECEPAEPPHGSSLVLLRIPVSQHEADRSASWRPTWGSSRAAAITSVGFPVLRARRNRAYALPSLVMGTDVRIRVNH